MKKYDAVVIGAGNAGISAAVALAKAGKKPLVIERHNLAGGCAGSFVRGRFEFDISLHTLDYHGMFQPVFEGEMGLTEHFYDVKPEFCNVYLENGKPVIEHYRCTEDLTKQIEALHPGCGKPFRKFMKVMKEVMEAFSELVLRPDPKPLKIFLRHPAFLKYGTKTLDQVFDMLKTPDYLRSLLSIYWWYGGASPADFPFNVYSMVAYSAFTGAVGFPAHTAHGYLAQMEAEIRKTGGDLLFNTSVTKINTKDGKVCSVETDQGDFIETDMVFSDINPTAVLGGMLTGCDSVREKYMPKYQPIKENFSFLTICLGLDCTAEELGLKEHHCIINEDPDINKVCSFSGSWDGPKTIGVNCPNITVPDFSPEGTCIVTISIPVQGSILDGLSQKEYIKKKRELELEYVAKAEQYLNIDIRSHIEEIDSFTPATLSRYAGLYNGALGNAVDSKTLMANRAITEELNKGAVKGLTFIGQYAGNLGYQNSVQGFMTTKGVLAALKGGK